MINRPTAIPANPISRKAIPANPIRRKKRRRRMHASSLKSLARTNTRPQREAA